MHVVSIAPSFGMGGADATITWKTAATAGVQ